MKYVLDSNIALKWVLPEIDSDKALRLRAGVQAGVLATADDRLVKKLQPSFPFIVSLSSRP